MIGKRQTETETEGQCRRQRRAETVRAISEVSVDSQLCHCHILAKGIVEELENTKPA